MSTLDSGLNLDTIQAELGVLRRSVIDARTSESSASKVISQKAVRRKIASLVALKQDVK